MALTLEQLRTPITPDEALTGLLTIAQSLGFNTTSWQSGSTQRTFIQIFAQVDSTFTNVTDSLSRLAFNNTSFGDGLTAFSSSNYDNDRIDATNTIGDIVLTGGAVGPPHVVAAGDIVAADAAGVTFRNITAGTIPASGTVTLSFQAETPGTTGNVANNTITILQTALAGVTINNPDPGSGSWITTLATDEETDAALISRNITKWGTLSPSDPADRYEFFVRTAVPSATRVEVDDSNPRGPGTLDVYIAAATGVSSAADVSATQTELDRIKNPTADVLALAATAQLQNFTYTAFVLTANNTAATQAAIQQALEDYTNGLDIGGDIFPDAIQGIWVLSEALQAMSEIAGVERVEFAVPTGNTSILGHHIMTVGAVTATYTSV